MWKVDTHFNEGCKHDSEEITEIRFVSWYGCTPLSRVKHTWRPLEERGTRMYSETFPQGPKFMFYSPAYLEQNINPIRHGGI
jgi:hypothetical protein